MDKCSDYVIWKGDTLDLRDGLRRWLTVPLQRYPFCGYPGGPQVGGGLLNGGKQSYTYWKRGK